MLALALCLLWLTSYAFAQDKPHEPICPEPIAHDAMPVIVMDDEQKPTTPSRRRPEPTEDIPVYKGREVDERAVVTKRPKPGYTEAARADHITGQVRLHAILCPRGYVSNIKVEKGLPDGLTETAIAAAKSIKFRPAKKDGKPVAQSVILEYNFIE